MERVRLAIHGKVQGVGFRWFVRENARRLGLAGWVRNRPDGSVEAMVGGVPELVERLVKAVHVGPDNAVVDSVVRERADPENGLPFPFTVIK